MTRLADDWSRIDTGAGLVVPGNRRFFTATGEERLEFLHGQVTANVTALRPGMGCAAATLTAQGRPLALFALYEDGERTWVATIDTAATRAALSRFLVADDCEFEADVEASGLTIAGPRSAEVLAAAGAPVAASLGDWGIAAATIAGQAVLLFSRGNLRVPSFDVLACDGEGRASDAAAVTAALEASGGVRVSVSALDIVRVESGSARYGVDVDDTRIAMEARLEWAIHFAKGCYVGQEVIERAVSRGRINHELCLLEVDGRVLPGAAVEGGGEADVVTSVAVSPRLGRLALAYLPRASTEAGTRVTLRGGDDVVEAVVLDWPRPRVLAGRE